MRDPAAAPPASAAAPQAPARNAPPAHPAHPAPALDTYNSHRAPRRARLPCAERRVYRPARRRTLSRIDEASADLASSRPVLRSRSGVSADTGRSVPVCNASHELGAQLDSASPQYAEPDTDSSSGGRPASMSDLPVVVPVDAATGAYIPYPEYAYYRDDGCGLARYELQKRMRKFSSKHANLYLAFMY